MSETGEPRIKLRSAILTDIGVVREHNEDAAAIDDQADFFVVADGMGGHAAGEVASAMAVETVQKELAEARDRVASFAKTPTDAGRKELVQILEAAVRKAHTAVYERGIREPDKQGMGTTLDVVLLAGPEAFVAHVGDSRTYLIRDGKAAQITTDHTVAEVLVIEGKLSVEEAQLSPLRTILVNAIGVAPDVGVEMAHVRLRSQDSLLLCSDGLHDYFPAESELAEHIAGSEPEKALDIMIELAKARGGHDNITGIIVEVLDAPDDDDGATPFEVDLTQPAADMATAVPEPVSAGDTLPHDLVEESDLDDSLDQANGLTEEDIKQTLRLKPLIQKKAQNEPATSREREKLARASTIPPEESMVAEADTIDKEIEADDEKDEKADDKKTDDKKADDEKADDEKADDKKADDKKADDKKADDKAEKADDKKADDKKADDKKADDKAEKADDKKASDKKAGSKKKSKKRKKKKSGASSKN